MRRVPSVLLAASLAVLTVLLLAVGVAPAAVADDSGQGRAVALPLRGGWPLDGAPTVQRGFDPPEQRWTAGHRGVDLAADPGAAVLASADGVVVFAGAVAGRGVLVIEHAGPGGGRSRTTYEPVAPRVAVGDVVALGEQVGVVATDPRPTPHCSPDRPCLHWGLRVGETYLDPLLLLSADGAPGDDEIRLLPASAVGRAEELARREAALSAGVGVGPGGEHGFLLPATGPLTSGFGMRFHPVLKVWKLHDGTDIGAPCGAPLLAPYAGVVVQREVSPALGHRLVVDHGVVDGHHVVTALNHAAGYTVDVGARVHRGQRVGTVGRTGYATGCHLHLMVTVDDELVDPMTWFT